MEYSESLYIDFAQRTRKNLDFIRESKRKQPSIDIYEVTQLINSLLGLLVFPQQQYYRQIPETPLEVLANQGWPIPTVIGDFPQVTDLRQLLRYLRNAVTHSNMKFLSDNEHQINGIQVWNRAQGEVVWRAELTISDLEIITGKFIELIIRRSTQSRLF